MSTRPLPPSCESACPLKPALGERPLLDAPAAARLGLIFRILASQTRLRLLHALDRDGELTPTALAEQLGMKVQAVSNQLQYLGARGIVSARRAGISIQYRLADPCVAALLDRGWCLAEDAELRAAQTSATHPGSNQ